MLASVPPAEIVTLATLLALGSTVSAALPVMTPDVACTCVRVGVAMDAFACTWPLEALMVATLESSMVQEKAGCGASGFDLASSPLAVKVKVEAGGMDCVAGETAMVLSACATVTPRSAWAAPEVAVMVAVPFFFAVTRPALSTLATVESLEVQANTASGMAAFRASLAVAVI